MDEMSQRLVELESRVAALEKRFGDETPASAPRGKKQSAKEFLIARKVSTETQKVLAFSYYLEHEESFPAFNVADLESVFRAAREKLPKNLNDAVNKNVARGFLMEAKERKDSKKTWHLTATGERFVEQEMGR